MNNTKILLGCGFVLFTIKTRAFKYYSDYLHKNVFKIVGIITRIYPNFSQSTIYLQKYQATSILFIYLFIWKLQCKKIYKFGPIVKLKIIQKKLS